MPHGVIILVGMATGPVGLHSANVVRKEITLKGSIVYVEEFPMAIEMLAKKAIDVSTMTSEVVPLDSYEDAFERLRRGEAIKILIQLQ